ncbi:unnamed protein product [Callosobruchus maculatus]|uniref:Uncharacterized protein n=2 Tax=Callosobruchus maculatus TaxID=64391 RepID=A0A653CCA9_CALMS|nr:unnamed protein product [Callosobruchus maculatus]
MSSRILIFVVLLALTTYVSAFFWSSSEPQSSANSYYYHKRLLQGPVYTVIDPTRPRIPAVPMQVPLQAQFQPISNIHNVQLVPCLCPVTNEPQYSEPIPQGPQPTQQEMYVSAQPQNFIQQQQQQQTQK